MNVPRRTVAVLVIRSAMPKGVEHDVMINDEVDLLPGDPICDAEGREHADGSIEIHEVKR